MMLSEETIELIVREFVFSASRSSGPGGQNVNKVSSKIEVRFNISSSAALNTDQKLLLISKLQSKLTSGGDLIVTCQQGRSQLQNKDSATLKIIGIIQKALLPKRKRKPTRPTKSSVEKRIEQKKKRSAIKNSRKIEGF
ncbi:MAG: aminoacyl-tRNA hydrolase [Bacteroidales bacterium]|nr:aminoacyl-tRNA hydrolase [Bacteroidales bacterium]